jgi:hypothetical protein
MTTRANSRAMPDASVYVSAAFETRLRRRLTLCDRREEVGDRDRHAEDFD